MNLPPFRVTDAAIDEIDRAGGSIRLDLEPGGCCGVAYSFTASPPHTDDAIFGCEGARLAVSAAALNVVVGATLDYGAQLHPPRYRVVRNPNTPQRCPCNRSFGHEFPGQRLPECRANCPMPWGHDPNRPASACETPDLSHSN